MAEPSAIYGPPSAFHPLHVILGAYPIACFTGALATDIVYAETADMMWVNFSVWLISVGIAMGVIAAIIGIIDFIATRRARSGGRAWPHTLGNALVLLLSLWNAFVHSRDAYTSMVPTGLTLSAIVAVLVLVTTWLGSSIAWRPRMAGLCDVGS